MGDITKNEAVDWALALDQAESDLSGVETMVQRIRRQIASAFHLQGPVERGWLPGDDLMPTQALPADRGGEELTDLDRCRQILAFDASHDDGSPMPQPSEPIPLGTAASALFDAIQELRWRRRSMENMKAAPEEDDRDSG
ncbi:MAG: hypothetical protein ABIH03_04070 [Pseudomonadota bacterium]